MLKKYLVSLLTTYKLTFITQNQNQNDAKNK